MVKVTVFPVNFAVSGLRAQRDGGQVHDLVVSPRHVPRLHAFSFTVSIRMTSWYQEIDTKRNLCFSFIDSGTGVVIFPLPHLDICVFRAGRMARNFRGHVYKTNYVIGVFSFVFLFMFPERS